MNKAIQRKTNQLMQQSSELILAVPQVMAHRLTRMVLAGHQPSLKDRREFQLMGAEKMAAFNESWTAMAAHTLHVQREFAFGMMAAWLTPASNTASTAASTYGAVSELHAAALDIIGKGFSPVHKRAVGNARRLGKSNGK